MNLREGDMRSELDHPFDGRHPYRSSRLTRDDAPHPIPAALARMSPVAKLLLLSLVVIAAWLALIGVRERRLTRAVQSLPPAVQEATYRRSWDELATTCANEPALAAHCSDEAEFILRFRQCQADCQKLARRYLSGVRR